VGDCLGEVVGEGLAKERKKQWVPRYGEISSDGGGMNGGISASEVLKEEMLLWGRMR
jgi:hypothetical protein